MPDISVALQAAGVPASGIETIRSADGRDYVAFSTRREPDALWCTLRTSLPAVGYWPVIIGDPRGLKETLSRPRKPGESVEEVIERASKINVDALVSAFRERRMKDYAESLADDEELDDLFTCTVADVADGASPKSGFYSTRRSKSGIAFLAVPTPVPAHVPAYFPYGGWNDCPYADVQVAFHQHWNRTHGSELAVMAGDVVETYVTRPVTDKALALALAKEQYAYCYDIVEQGTASIPALATELLNAKYWFFWWD